MCGEIFDEIGAYTGAHRFTERQRFTVHLHKWPLLVGKMASDGAAKRGDSRGKYGEFEVPRCGFAMEWKGADFVLTLIRNLTVRKDEDGGLGG
jgi:hypothetical protein